MDLTQLLIVLCCAQKARNVLLPKLLCLAASPPPLIPQHLLWVRPASIMPGCLYCDELKPNSQTGVRAMVKEKILARSSKGSHNSWMMMSLFY